MNVVVQQSAAGLNKDLFYTNWLPPVDFMMFSNPDLARRWTMDYRPDKPEGSSLDHSLWRLMFIIVRAPSYLSD